jgi:hypothetical protein
LANSQMQWKILNVQFEFLHSLVWKWSACPNCEFT